MNHKPLKLMCVLAHPDDESLAIGGTLVKYASSGVQTYLVMATRGERGWFGPASDDPGPQACRRDQPLEPVAEQEIQAPGRVLRRRGGKVAVHRRQLDQGGARFVEFGVELGEAAHGLPPA